MGGEEAEVLADGAMIAVEFAVVAGVDVPPSDAAVFDGMERATCVAAEVDCGRARRDGAMPSTNV